MKHKLLLCMLLLGVVFSANAKKLKYEISLTIKGNRDTMMMMGYYYANGTYVIDTAKIDNKGRFVFSSEKRGLLPGLYFFSNKVGTYVEFVVYNEKPFFQFETEEQDWTSNMKVKGSLQNQQFYDFHRFDAQCSADLENKSSLLDSAAFAQYRRHKLIEMDSMKEALITTHPELLLSKMMMATKEPITPAVNENGDSLNNRQRWDYYMSHYFDNMPLDDDMLIRTPPAVFYNRYTNYVDKYLKNAPPEVIIPLLDNMIDRAKPSKEVFKWLVMNLTQKYLQSSVMVYDSIYVHLVHKYFATDQNWWSSPSNIEKELQRADKWSKLLVGVEAPELILFDTAHVPHSLHALPYKYKLLVFWSPTCGHCKTVIPGLYKKFEEYHQKYNIGAFTILSEPDDHTRGLWKKFLMDNDMTSRHWLSLDGGEANIDWHDVYDIQSTPQIYLIDENNIILAKRLSDNTFETVLKAIVRERGKE